MRTGYARDDALDFNGEHHVIVVDLCFSGGYDVRRIDAVEELLIHIDVRETANAIVSAAAHAIAIFGSFDVDRFHNATAAPKAPAAAAIAMGGPQLRTSNASASSRDPCARNGRITYIGYANARNATAASVMRRSHESFWLPGIAGHPRVSRMVENSASRSLRLV